MFNSIDINALNFSNSHSIKILLQRAWELGVKRGIVEEEAETIEIMICVIIILYNRMLKHSREYKFIIHYYNYILLLGYGASFSFSNPFTHYHKYEMETTHCVIVKHLVLSHNHETTLTYLHFASCDMYQMEL